MARRKFDPLTIDGMVSVSGDVALWLRRECEAEWTLNDCNTPVEFYPDEDICEAIRNYIARVQPITEGRLVRGGDIVRESIESAFRDGGGVYCECGHLDGIEPCAWTGPADDTVEIEYMPRQARSQHQAAGYESIRQADYGATRARVELSCARRFLDDPEDGMWTRIVDAGRS